MRINLALATERYFENMFLLHDSTPLCKGWEFLQSRNTTDQAFTSEVKQMMVRILTAPVINISAVPITCQVWFWVIYKW